MWGKARVSKLFRLVHAAFRGLSQVLQPGQARSVPTAKPDFTQRAGFSGWFEPDDRNEIHSWGRDGPLTDGGATSTPILTHTLSCSHTHTCVLFTSTHLCFQGMEAIKNLIAKRPTALQGINNRPDPETANTISTGRRRKSVAVFGDLEGV